MCHMQVPKKIHVFIFFAQFLSRDNLPLLKSCSIMYIFLFIHFFHHWIFIMHFFCVYVFRKIIKKDSNCKLPLVTQILLNIVFVSFHSFFFITEYLFAFFLYIYKCVGGNHKTKIQIASYHYSNLAQYCIFFFSFIFSPSLYAYILYMAKKKYLCVYCHMSKKSRVGRSGLIFFIFFIIYYRQNRK